MTQRKLIKVSRGYKVILDVIGYIKMMYRKDKIDFEKIRFKVTPNYTKKEIKLKFKGVR